METNSTTVEYTENIEWQNLVVILSNFFMFFPIKFTFRKKLYLETVVFLLSTISSIIYHSLLSFHKNLTHKSVMTIKYIDFYIASITLSIVSIHLINYKKDFLVSIHLLLSSCMISFLLYYYNNTDLQIYQLVLIGTSFGSLILKYLISREMPKWNKKKVLMTLPIVSVAIACFYIQNPYWIFHSLWHCFIMISIYYALGIPIPFQIRMHRDVSLQVIIPSPPRQRIKGRHKRSFSW